MSPLETDTVAARLEAGEGRTTRRILTGLFSGYALQYLSVPLTLAGSIYLLRSLSVAEYGTLALLLAVSLYLSVFSHLGIPMAIVRYVAEYRSEGRHRAAWVLLGWAFLFRYAALALALGATVLMIGPVSRLLNAPALDDHFRLFALFIVIDVSVQMCSAVLEALLLQPYLNAAQVVFAALKLALFVAFLGAGWGLDGAIVALILSDLGLLLLYASGAARELSRSRGGRGLDGDLPRLARYCGAWYFGKVSSLVFDDSTDLYLVSFFLGPGAAGLYAFACTAANQSVRFLSPSAHLWSALTPASVSSARHDGAVLTSLFRLATKAILFFSAPVVVGAFLLGDKGIGYVFGVQYAPAALLFALWTVTICLSELEQPVRMLMVVREKVGALFVNRFLIVYNLAAAVLLIPPLGLLGAIAATGTTTLFALGITYAAARRHHPLAFPWRDCPPIAANAALTAVALLALRPYVTGLVSLLAVGTLGVALYFALARLWSPFRREEVEFLGRGVSPRIARALEWATAGTGSHP